MIDEKKKQNGMKTCFDRRIDDKVEREFMRDPLIAYTRAFNDAIDWFKNVLWHDASEKPEFNRRLITQHISLMGELGYDLTTNISAYSWELYDKGAHITKGCYIEDILPLAHDATKGGEE